MRVILLNSNKNNPQLTQKVIEFLIEYDLMDIVIDKKTKEEKVKISQPGKIALEILSKVEKREKLEKKKQIAKREAIQ